MLIKLKNRDVRKILLDAGFAPEKVQDFLIWNSEHSWVFQAVCYRFLELINENSPHIGTKGIFEDLRRDPRYKKFGNYKLSNLYTSYYARILVAVFPQYRDKLILKSLKSSGNQEQQAA